MLTMLLKGETTRDQSSLEVTPILIHSNVIVRKSNEVAALNTIIIIVWALKTLAPRQKDLSFRSILLTCSY